MTPGEFDCRQKTARAPGTDWSDGGHVQLTEPAGYLDMLVLQCDAAAIMTDLGGIQEEACMVGTPCVTVRRNTERGITVAVGANRLAAADASEIGRALAEALAGGRACGSAPSAGTPTCPHAWRRRSSAV